MRGLRAATPEGEDACGGLGVLRGGWGRPWVWSGWEEGLGRARGRPPDRD